MGDGTCVFFNGYAMEENVPISAKRPGPSTTSSFITELLRRVEASKRRREHVKSKRNGLESKVTERARSASIKGDHRLWVDKHAPRSFSHLLSDERTNREVVRALRAWDPYVFHQDPPPRPASVQEYNQQHQKDEKPVVNRPTVSKSTDKKEDCKQQDQRPDESNRVILLSGNPGVGKSTLAAIAARHCGYRPLEINGSDERSASVLEERVLRTMESQTLNFSNNSDSTRPTCLILDEIDGADACGAIKTLVEIIRADIPKKGCKKSSRYLRRPIIFICNNKFVPALRPLLPFCKQFNVAPPVPSRLVSRLRTVLALEGMAASAGGSLLHQLVTDSSGDIRSCLFTLQFASTKAKETSMIKSRNVLGTSSVVDVSDTLAASLRGDGLKDSRNDVAGTTASVFLKEKQKNIPGGFALRKPRKMLSSDNIMELVQGSGESSRIIDSLFINVPRISTIDPTFDRCAGALELLSSIDLLRSHTTHASQNNASEVMSMQTKYLPCGAAAVHVLCRVEKRQDLVFTTRELADNRFNMETNRALTHQFVESLALQSRTLRSADLVAVETSPYVLWILSAGDGSGSLDCIASSMNLLSPRVQISFENHVSALRSLGLTYVKAHKDQSTHDSWSKYSNNPTKMILEPALDRFVHFQHIVGDQRRPLPEAVSTKTSAALVLSYHVLKGFLHIADERIARTSCGPRKNHGPLKRQA